MSRFLTITLFILFSIFVLRTPLYSSEEAPEVIEQPKDVEKMTPSYLGGLFISVSLGANGSYWSIDDKSDSSSNSSTSDLKFKTEGLMLGRAAAEVGYSGNPIIGAVYESPLSPSEEQQYMLSKNVSKTNGAEMFTGDIKLNFLTDLLFPQDSLGKKVMKILLSFRYRYSKEVFFGEATTSGDAIYVPWGTKIDYDECIINGGIPLSASDSLTFRTALETSDITFEVLDFGSHGLRIGGFNTDWKRPADCNGVTVGGNKVIYDAEFSSKGGLISLETNDPSSNGINLDLSFWMGFSNTLDTSVDIQKILGKVDTSSYAMVSLAAWYNLYFSSKNEGFFVTPGISYSMRFFSLDNNKMNEKEQLIKPYITLGYRF